MKINRSKTRGLTRALLIFLSFIVAVSLITSCGFIGAIFGDDDKGKDGDAGGNGDEQKIYTLTIHYSYNGISSGSISTSRPIVFLIMPLDENNEVIDDPFEPVILRAFIPTGTIYVDLVYGSYGILAFDDADNDDFPSYLEKYVLFDGYSQADAYFDAVYIGNDSTIFIEIDDDYEWHRVYIVSPYNGELKTENFIIFGGFVYDGDPVFQVSSIRVEIDDTFQEWAEINSDEIVWMYPGEDNILSDIIILKDFRDGTHTLTARAFNSAGDEVDSYSINFDEYDGHEVFIRSPSDGEYMYDSFDAGGGFTDDEVASIEVEIDGVFQGYASIDYDNKTWSFGINIYTLANGDHTMTVTAYNESSVEIDSYPGGDPIIFTENDGM